MGFAGRHSHDQAAALCEACELSLQALPFRSQLLCQQPEATSFSQPLCLTALPPQRHAREASVQLLGLPGLASNVANVPLAGAGPSAPPGATHRPEPFWGRGSSGLFLGRGSPGLATSLSETEVCLKAGTGLCLQSGTCKNDPAEQPASQTLHQPVLRRRLDVHAASWTRCPSNKTVNNRAVGKPGEIIMLIMLLSFSNRGNGTLRLVRGTFFLKINWEELTGKKQR